MLETHVENYERSLDRIVALMVLLEDAEYLGNEEFAEEYEERLQEAISDRDEAANKIAELGGVILDGSVVLP